MHSTIMKLKSAVFFAVVVASVAFPVSRAAAQPPPLVTSVDPTEGHQGEQDVDFTVYGDNFVDGAEVFFENLGVHLDGFVVFIGPTELQLVIDIDLAAPLGPGDVFVINPDFQQGSLVDGFTVLVPEPPVIDSVVPNTGYTGEAGLGVSIFGDLLYTVTDVGFGAGITVDSIDYIGGKQIDCTISIGWAAVPGLRTVTVFSPYGNGELVDGFEILAYLPPGLSSVNPDWGYQGESGKILTVTGSEFLPGIDFEFLPVGNIDLTDVQFDSDTQVTLTVDIQSDASVRFYDVRCWNTDGQDDILVNGFEVLALPPEIEWINPTQGPRGAIGLPVAINGAHLGNVDTVDFGLDITVVIVGVSDNRVDVELDIDAAAGLGFRDVTVSGIDGEDTLPGGFEVVESMPEIESVFPFEGYRGDIALPVTITGIDLELIDTVDFGLGITVGIVSVAANQIDVELDIEVDAPLGPHDVSVSGPTGGDTLPGGFEVLPGEVRIDSIDPDMGQRGDVVPVEIVGLNLVSVTSITLGVGITATILGASDTVINADFDIDWDAPLGFYDVTLYSPYGDGVLVNGFEVLPGEPQIDLVNPDQGERGAIGLPVIITGLNLGLVDTVSFGAGVTVSISGASDARLDLFIDIDSVAALGFRDVTVQSMYGEDTLFGGFEVTPGAPRIDLVDPDQGERGAVNFPVTITGLNLGPVDAISFGSGISVIWYGTSDTLIDVLINIVFDATPGFRDVTAQSVYGEDTLVAGFEVIVPAPEIVHIYPDQGVQGDTDLAVTITGEHFEVGAYVSFDNPGITVTSTSWPFPTQIDVLLDIDLDAPLGACDVTVENLDAQYDILVDGFTVLEAPVFAPEIYFLDPNYGYQGDLGLGVIITGANFQDGADVWFDNTGITVTSVYFSAPTQLELYIDIDPAAPLGACDVTVENPDSQYDILVNGFTVLEAVVAPPEIYELDPNFGYQGDMGLGIIITGANFVDGADVWFDNTGINVTSVYFAAPTQLELYIDIDPAAPLGACNVTVENPDSQYDILVNGFTVLEAAVVPPEIYELDPNFGYQGDMGLGIYITGANFQDGLDVEFDHSGIDVMQIDFIDATSMTVFIDIHGDATTGFCNVGVVNPDFGSDIMVDGFEVRAAVSVDEIVPSEGEQGQTIDIDILGQGFQWGAEVTFEDGGVPSIWFDIVTTGVGPSAIDAVLTIYPDAPVGYYDVRVTNLNMTTAVLQDGFLVLEHVLPPEPGNLVPADVCIGDIGVTLTLWGAHFQPGIEATFEYGGLPTDAIYDVITTFIDEWTIEITLSVQYDADEGLYDLIVTNPDSQYAYAPPLHVYDCMAGLLTWEDSFLDVFIEVPSPMDDWVQAQVTAGLLNIGDGDYEGVVVSMTDLIEADGVAERAISPEHVEIFPSIVGQMLAGGHEDINIVFTLPIGGDLLPYGQGGTFLGSLIAQDTDTGDMATLPVSVVVVVPVEEFVEIEPWCLQVDLFGPGGPADMLPQMVYEDGQVLTDEVIDILGGCESPFPMFEWASYAGDCPGYMEIWRPGFTLTVYPVYPGQSAEEGLANPPVWRETDLYNPFLQYPSYAEPLAGVYLWQVEAVPVAMPGSGVSVGPLSPVLSEIWAFCVEGEIIGAPPEWPAEEGMMVWVPESLYMAGCGMLPATLVISHEIAGQIGPDTPLSLTIRDRATDDYITIDLNLEGIQFSEWNPLPEFGPAAITFGIAIKMTGEVALDMDPSDFSLQVWNGGNLLGELDLDEDSEGEFDFEAWLEAWNGLFSFEHDWVFDLDCWSVWYWWWSYQELLKKDCEEEWEAFWNAFDNLQAAEEAYDEAFDEFLDAVEALADAYTAEDDAEAALEDAQQACYDFFANCVFSNDVTFSDPGEGWNHVGAFGGAVDVWFRGSGGAHVLDVFLEKFGDKYRELWDALRDAQDAVDQAQEDTEAAEEAADEAEEAFDEACENLDNAQAAFDAALDALLECLEEMGEIQEIIDLLELVSEECFGQTMEGPPPSGLGAGPGSDGEAEGPPVEGGEGGGEEGGAEDEGGAGEDGGAGAPPSGGAGDGGTQFPPGWGGGQGTGIGQNQSGPCPCGDCDDELAALQEAQRALERAQRDLGQRRQLLAEAQQRLANGQQAVNDAQQALNDAQAVFGETQDELDTFMEKHVFSGVVSGDPSTGPNYIGYKGVDIYFSDFDVFRNIFELIQPWIDEIAARHELNQQALRDAQRGAADAQGRVARAQAEVGACQGRITRAQNRVTAAALRRDAAQRIYDDCIRRVNQCRQRHGCPPLPGWQPPGEEAPGVPGEDVPGAPAGEGERGVPGEAPGVPPGQPTGPVFGEGAEDECPCEGCEREWNAWQEALRTVEQARQARADAYAQLTAAGTKANEAQKRYDWQKAWVDSLKEQLENIDPDAPDADQERARLNNQLGVALMALLGAEMDFRVAGAELLAAHGAVNSADAALEAAEAAARTAENAYNTCMRRLRECEREQDCEPSEAPGGGEGGGYDIPSVPEDWEPPWEGEEEGPGGATGPQDEGGEVPDGAAEGVEEGECPCEDCLDELLALRAAEAAKNAALGAWSDALPGVWQAEDALAEAQRAEAEADEAVEEAQEAVDKLQERLDSFMDDHVFVDGVSGDPSAGPNHVVYNGVHIYFSGYNMFKNVFELIKDGIRRLNQRLQEAKARLAAAKAAQQAAREANAQARAALDAARATERAAWAAYRAAVSAYFDALKAYRDCLEARRQCIEDHPEECEGESVEPDEGGVGQSGGTHGKELGKAVGPRPSAPPGASTAVSGRLEGSRRAEDEAKEAIDEIAERIEELARERGWTDEALEAARQAVEDARAALAAAEADHESILDALRAMMDSIADAADRMWRVREWIPDTAFIIEGDITPPEGCSALSLGDFTICYPEEVAGEVQTWVRENEDEWQDAHDAWSLASDGAQDVAQALADAMDAIADGLVAVGEASAVVAGLEARLEILDESSDYWTEESEDRESDMEERLSTVVTLLDQVLALQAE